MHAEGKLGCLVDGSGRFYKPLQVCRIAPEPLRTTQMSSLACMRSLCMQAGERGAREAAFYESLRLELETCADGCSGAGGVGGSPPLPRSCSGQTAMREPITNLARDVQVRRPGRLAAVGETRSRSVRGTHPCWMPCRATVRSSPEQPCGHGTCARDRHFSFMDCLTRAVWRADGVVELGGGTCLELEDIAHGYRRPCIMDVKLGRQTWYPGADPAYAERCAARDAATMQAAAGFRICGMQVHASLNLSCMLHVSGHVWLSVNPEPSIVMLFSDRLPYKLSLLHCPACALAAPVAVTRTGLLPDLPRHTHIVVQGGTLFTVKLHTSEGPAHGGPPTQQPASQTSRLCHSFVSPSHTAQGREVRGSSIASAPAW